MAPPVEKLRDCIRRPGGEGTSAPAFSSSSCGETDIQELSDDRMRSLTAQGVRDAADWRFVDGTESRAAFARRWRSVSRQIRKVSRGLRERQAGGATLPADEIWLLENGRLLQTLSQEISDALKSLRGLAVRGEENAVVPRTFALAASFLHAVDLIPTERALFYYIEGIQQVDRLMMAELWALKAMLEFAILEQIAAHTETIQNHREISRRTKKPSAEGIAEGMQKTIEALRIVHEMDWKGFFDQNNAAERVLRQDPSGAYPHMDDESRQMYRNVVEEFARQSLFSEEEVARQAVILAMRAKDRARRPGLRSPNRRTHVGYYLMASGSHTLKKRLGYKPSLKQRILDTILEWPEVFFIVGVELTTVALCVLPVAAPRHYHSVCSWSAFVDPRKSCRHRYSESP